MQKLFENSKMCFLFDNQMSADIDTYHLIKSSKTGLNYEETAPHYSQILCLWVQLLINTVLEIQNQYMQHSWTCVEWQKNLTCLTHFQMRLHKAAQSYCFSFHTEKKCAVYSIHSAIFFTFFCAFYWWFCFKCPSTSLA